MSPGFGGPTSARAHNHSAELGDRQYHNPRPWTDAATKSLAGRGHSASVRNSYAARPLHHRLSPPGLRVPGPGQGGKKRHAEGNQTDRGRTRAERGGQTHSERQDRQRRKGTDGATPTPRSPAQASTSPLTPLLPAVCVSLSACKTITEPHPHPHPKRASPGSQAAPGPLRPGTKVQGHCSVGHSGRWSCPAGQGVG